MGKKNLKQDYLVELKGLIEFLAPISREMASCNHLSEKPIEQMKNLKQPLDNFLAVLSSMDGNSRSIRALNKKLVPLLCFKETPFKNRVFSLNTLGFCRFMDETMSFDEITLQVQYLKDYQELVAHGLVDVDPQFTCKHTSCYKMVNGVSTCIVHLTDQLRKIYEKETKPSRFAFLSKR